MKSLVLSILALSIATPALADEIPELVVTPPSVAGVEKDRDQYGVTFTDGSGQTVFEVSYSAPAKRTTEKVIAEFLVVQNQVTDARKDIRLEKQAALWGTSFSRCVWQRTENLDSRKPVVRNGIKIARIVRKDLSDGHSAMIVFSGSWLAKDDKVMRNAFKDFVSQTTVRFP